LKVSNCSAGKLVAVMDEVFGHQNIGAVIGVSLSMMDNSKAAIQAEIRNRQRPKERDGSGPFVPVRDFAQCYIEKGNLFM
jgi:hypothetical protein